MLLQLHSTPAEMPKPTTRMENSAEKKPAPKRKQTEKPNKSKKRPAIPNTGKISFGGGPTNGQSRLPLTPFVLWLCQDCSRQAFDIRETSTTGWVFKAELCKRCHQTNALISQIKNGQLSMGHLPAISINECQI